MMKTDAKQTNPDAAVRRGYLIEDYRIFHINSIEKEAIPPHFHGFHKLILVIRGNLQYSIEGTVCRVQPGELLYVPAGAIHQPLIGEEPYERIVLWISTEAPELAGLEEAFRTAAEERRYLYSDPETAEQVRRIAKAENEKEFGTAQLKNALLTEVLVGFGREALRKSAEDGHSPVRTGNGQRQDELTVRVADYIAEHLAEDLGTRTLAERFYLSESSLAARFARAFGCSVHRYVLQKRLVTAARRIRIGIPPVQAAEEAGFADYSTFYRAFIRYYDVSPKKFRQ